MAVYTTIDDAGSYFNTLLYEGNSNPGPGSQSITGVGFQPDFVWIKNTDQGYAPTLFDSVRGATEALETSDNGGQATDANSLTAFDADGFSLGSNEATNGDSQVSWNWKANGTGSANTEGDINTTISANTTSGFSIIDGCDDLSDGDTFGHGLDSAPNMVWLKRTDSTSGWRVFYTGITSGSTLILNETDAVASDNDCINSVSSTLITIKGSGTGGTEGDNENVAYAWQSVQGYSKIGSYTGNGNADGSFVYTGFRPAYVMIKKTNSTGNWCIYDNRRVGYNPNNNEVYADLTNVEGDVEYVDILSNGFKLTSTTSETNNSGDTYIYMAFAHSPFVNSKGVPTNAR